MIHSIAGLLHGGGRLMRQRPFRDPHHSASLLAFMCGAQCHSSEITGICRS
jgi:magnesium chelatase family protein